MRSPSPRTEAPSAGASLSGALTRATHESVVVIDPMDIAGRQARTMFAPQGLAVFSATTAQDGLALIGEVRPDVVVACLDTADLPGLQLLETIRRRFRRVPVVVVARHPTVEGAVEALRGGAADYTGRPISPGMLSEKVARALTGVRTARQLAETEEQVQGRWGFGQLISQSASMVRVFEAIRAVAATDATVLIRGETGTGKELVARALHEGSRRRQRPLIGVNCGAFTETLLESELFGHEKGSFTGAVGQRRGVFELADGGSLFLDELGETSLSVQVNLLRVLEDFTFRRVGGTESVKVEVRIIAATNVDLETAVTQGRFRQDLFYRLNVFPIILPPLRERPEDIPMLMEHFLKDAATEYGLPPPTLLPEALDRIARYRWPGNVRQLRAMCERWVIVCAGGQLGPHLLPAEIANPEGSGPPAEPGGLYVDDSIPLGQLKERVFAQIERVYLHKMLTRHGGRLQRTAEAAGITRRTLYTRMKELGLDPADYKSPGDDG